MRGFFFARLKGIVSDKKNIQISLEIKKNTFQSQHYHFSKTKQNKNKQTNTILTTFYKISFCVHSLKGWQWQQMAVIIWRLKELG